MSPRSRRPDATAAALSAGALVLLVELVLGNVKMAGRLQGLAAWTQPFVAPVTAPGWWVSGAPARELIAAAVFVVVSVIFTVAISDGITAPGLAPGRTFLAVWGSVALAGVAGAIGEFLVRHGGDLVGSRELAATVVRQIGSGALWGVWVGLAAGVVAAVAATGRR